MIRIGIIGATGYTALELIRILDRHPHARITRITSRESSGKQVGEVHSSLRHLAELEFKQYAFADFKQNVDFSFSCLPHAASAPIVEELVAGGIKTVDFSADYRLDDVASFEKWYEVDHPAPQRLGQVPYGIPELFESDIREAILVANPGCFPSSVVIPLAPIIKAGLIETSSIIVDSKTGISGAGRKAKLKFHFPECNESVTAYAIGQHRHEPEMDQILKRFSGKSTEIIFSPHLIPMDRGILSTIYARPANGATPRQMLTTLQTVYQQQPFIRIIDEIPATKDVTGTNFCDITIRQSRNHVVIFSALDNLIKGASGAAVQNFNLMNGLDQRTALMQ